jgi:hypothetical protein
VFAPAFKHFLQKACAIGRRRPDQRVETGLAGWACRIRTGESVRELPDWNYVTTSSEGGASRAAETLRLPAASNGFAAPAKVGFSRRSLARKASIESHQGRAVRSLREFLRNAHSDIPAVAQPSCQGCGNALRRLARCR